VANRPAQPVSVQTVCDWTVGTRAARQLRAPPCAAGTVAVMSDDRHDRLNKDQRHIVSAVVLTASAVATFVAGALLQRAGVPLAAIIAVMAVLVAAVVAAVVLQS
jgi:hypothetical protein